MADKAWQDMTERERTDHLFAVVTTQGQEIRDLRAAVEACTTEIDNLRQKLTEADEKIPVP